MIQKFTRKEFVRDSSKLFLLMSGTGLILSNCNSQTKTKIRFSRFAEAMSFVENYKDEKSVEVNGVWTFPQMIAHCAQSIEYSIKGFPVNKSAMFQNTIGHLAFEYFSYKGEMSHSLSEPIPGAPEIPKDLGVQESIKRLFLSIDQFLNYKGNFAPHFAYGNLTKKEYEKAHSFHLANHLSELI